MIANGIESKGRSPFFPDQPVPIELFVGRKNQIERIMTRAVGQVAGGKPVSVFLEGEYGIGKTSVARFTQWMAEKDYGLLSVYATLERVESIDDVGGAILEATIRSGIYNPKLGEKIREGLAKFIGEQSPGGVVTMHFEALHREAPNISRGLLPFFRQTLERVRDSGTRGIFLVLDEINGVVENPKFAPFLKAIVDSNAAISLEKPALPLLIMLCGVEERRRQMVSRHEPVGRIFDVITIDTMSAEEMKIFFCKAFESVHTTIESDALEMMVHHTAGFPKIMHLIGNAAYWIDRDRRIDKNDATQAIFTAADEFGKRYVDHQVYGALHSADYRTILAKIAAEGPGEMTFRKVDISKKLTKSEQAKFHNFLPRMQRLRVIRSTGVSGEYIFNVRMVRLYIWLNSIKERGYSKPR